MAPWHIDSSEPAEPTPGFDTEFAYSFKLVGAGDEHALLRMEWIETPADPTDSTALTTATRYLESLSDDRWPARVVVVQRDANYRIIEPDESV